MANFFKTRGRELTLAIAAVLLLLAALGIVGEGIRFLVRGLYSVFGVAAEVSIPEIQFDIEGAQELDL